MKKLSPKRLVAGLLLFFFLAGPTPGAVGSCDENRTFTPLVAYCEEREQLVCWRRYMRGELEGGQQAVDECRRTAIQQCQNRYWSPDCRPTTRQTDACINALSSYDTLHIPESEIAECSVQALCKVKTEPRPDFSGAGAGS